MQHLRVKYRWEEIEKENQALKTAKEQNIKYESFTFPNEDSAKQLLARSRYILAKNPNKWTTSQEERAKLLFAHYPLLHQAYKHTMEFRNIYEEVRKEIAREKMTNWIKKTKLLNRTVFNTVANSLNYYLVQCNISLFEFLCI